MRALTGIHPVSICFFVFVDLVFAHVEPPKNVTLDCKNLENILEWEYDQMEPGLKFRVDIKSDYELKNCSKQLWVDEPPLRVDLSYLSNPNAGYWVTVKTVVGQNESAPSPPEGITFTYSLSFLDAPKCLLDFLLVNVTALPDDHVQFRFDHPWLRYGPKVNLCDSPKKKKKKPRETSVLPDFMYNVVISGEKEQHHNFQCWTNVCEEKLHVRSAQGKLCLRIDGELENMMVKPEQEFCTVLKEKTALDPIAISIGVVSCLLAVAFIFFMVYRKKTRPDTALPNPLEFNKQKKGQSTMTPVQESVCPIDHYSSSPLISPTDLENGVTPVVTGSTEDDLRMSLGISSNTPTDLDGGSINGERSAYMQGSMLEDHDNEETSGDEQPHSPYERRAVVVELAPDDRNEGYRG